MADSSVTFSTALDNEQLEKDIKKTEREIDSLKRKLEQSEGEESFAKRQMDEAKQAAEEAQEAVRSLRDELGVGDEGALAASLREANREAAQLEGKLGQANASKTAIEEEMERDEIAIRKTEGEVQRLEGLLRELESVDPTNAEEWFGAQSEIGGVREALAEANAELERQVTYHDGLNDRWQALDSQAKEYAAGLAEATSRQSDLAAKSERLGEATQHLKEQTKEQERLTKKWRATNEQTQRYTRQLEQATDRQRQLGEEYARTYSRAGSSVSAGMDRARSAMDNFTSRINTMLKRVFVFGVILKALRSIAEALTAALDKNDRFSASFANLKATVTGVVNAIAGLLAPALTGMVNAATSAIEHLARTIDSIFGTNIMKAIQSARKVAEANWRQTEESKAAQKALDKQAKAAKKLAKAEDKAAHSVLGFDEINALQADTAADAADALDDQAEAIADPGSLMRPDWDALDVGKIDAKLAEIMLILGAALMAVGAILAFSGINIPLGITLMVIGALMVYAAYKEQWDKLPAEVQRAITSALVITGVVLVVLGAIFAFSGVNIPLGVGMMVAGALLLWTAVGLNWQTMSEELRNVVSALMLVLSGALLVIGAILAFSGANPALGIALMVVGAASLAGVVALNWERMPEEVRNVVSVIMGVLGGAMLVVGAILALSGVNLPLGIGLMAAGAIVLGADAALNWDAIQQHLDEVIPLLQASLSAAALVIGAVLAFSGANLPLGIGLLSVGAIGLGSAVIENWDKIPEEVKGVIATVEVTVGAASLVVGAVLTFSGVNLPLGLALLATGALAMGNALTDNWNLIPENVRNVIVTIEAIVGPALLAVGAALTFSGVNLPLGLSLLAAGALALAHIASLDWNKMPEGVRSTVTTIMGIVGAALVVLGIILCVTGVGIPIGIACIVAGAASLVTAAAINWDFIVDKVREIWGKVKSFWDNNIAHVFTWQFWEGVFKSIVNGLIGALNNGLGAFSGFINDLAGGVCNLLNFFGVSGWSFSLSIPQIPYLAAGAVIPPNREFMAVLGDQRHGNNIEAPESLMRQVVREEAGAMMAETVRAIMASGGMGAGGAQGRDVVLMVGTTELARVTVNGIRNMQESGELGDALSLGFA